MSIFDYENKITKESLKGLGFEDILPSCKDILMTKTFVLRYKNKDFVGSSFTMNLTLVIIESYGKIRMEARVDHFKVAKYPICEIGDVTFAIEDIKKHYHNYVFVR
jgi:hypothetical protein